MHALELANVTKRYGDKVAVDGLSLVLEEGEFLGLLGRNGAGKSTTLKMLTGLLPPTSGKIHLLGIDMDVDPLAIKRQVGVMPEDMALLEMLTGPQYLRFVGRMYGLEDDVIDTRQKELFEKLDLEPGAKAVLGGTYAVCMRYAPWLLLPAMIGLLGLSAVLHRAMAPRSNMLLRAGREKILGALAGAD